MDHLQCNMENLRVKSEQGLGILCHSAIFEIICDLAAELATWRLPPPDFILHPECNVEDDSYSLKHT